MKRNGADRTTTFVSSTRITATIPAADIATAGTASVTVYTPAPGGGTSSAQTLLISAVPLGGAVVTTEKATTYTYLAYSNTYKQQAQSVKAAGTGISQISVALAKKGSPTQVLTLHVRKVIGGTDLATATITPDMVTSTLPANPTWVTLPVSATGLTPGTTYYVVLKAGTTSLRNYYTVPLNGQNPYKDGAHYKNTIGSLNSNTDMLVKVWFTGT